MEMFYYCQTGKITVDGIDIRDLSPHWLRRQIGLVTQEPSLFASSIEENVVYGCLALEDIKRFKKDEGKEMEGEERETERERERRERVEEMTSLANAKEFIAKLPDGLATQVCACFLCFDCLHQNQYLFYFEVSFLLGHLMFCSHLLSLPPFSLSLPSLPLISGW